MQIKQVRAYQTSDGTTHTDELKAVTEQGKLDIRGILQTALGGTGIGNNISITDAARLILANREKLSPLLYTYGRKIKSVAAKNEKIEKK